jgi:hypothetical protein
MTIEQAKQVLIDNGYIDYFWHKEDIKTQAEDRGIELSDFSVDVIAENLKNVDANEGINNDVIMYYVYDHLGIDEDDE